MTAFTIVQVSDTHLSRTHAYFQDNWEVFLDEMAALKPDLVLHSGDVSFNGPDAPDDLAFARDRECIILELHVPAGDDDQAVLVRMIEAGYAAHLRQYPDARAEVIRRHLRVQVLPYGVRVR